MLPSDVKAFLEKYIHLIENNQFDLLYDYATSVRENLYAVGLLTDALLDAGVSPLDHMKEVPPLYLDTSRINSFVIPDHIERICKGGFAYSRVETVLIPANCELSTGCFMNSDITSIDVPNIMNEIPDECCYNCSNLRYVNLKDIEQIGSEAFANCESLGEIFIPDTIEYICDNAFYGSENVTFAIHDKNNYAKEYADKHNIKVRIVS